MGRTSSSLLRVRKTADVFESLVAQHHIVVGEGVGGQAGAQHVDAVEGGLGGDGVLVAAEGERVLGDGDGEVLGHLERVDHLADPQPDGVLAAQRPTLTAGGRSDLVELRFGGGEQLAAFAGAFGGEGGVAAADQPLAGVVGWVMATRFCSSNSDSCSASAATKALIWSARSALSQSR